MVKVSVVLPVYNVEKYLGDCLTSVVSQSLSDIEIICVNDGSTDSSATILEEFQKRDKRLHIINQENLGAAAARNSGLNAAVGEYISLLDSDDIYEENMLEIMYSESKKNNLDTVIAYSYDLDNKTGERILPKYHLKKQYLPAKKVFNYTDMAEYIFNFSVGWAWDKMYRREFIEKYGLRFPNLKNTEDAYFVFMGLVLAKRISVIDDVLMTHRVNNDSQLSSSKEKGLLCFVDAINQIQESLVNYNLYKSTEKSFLNWVMEHTVWQYRTAKNDESKNIIKKVLLEELYPKLKMPIENADYFYDKIAYERMLEIVESEKNARIPT